MGSEGASVKWCGESKAIQHGLVGWAASHGIPYIALEDRRWKKICNGEAGYAMPPNKRIFTDALDAVGCQLLKDMQSLTQTRDVAMSTDGGSTHNLSTMATVVSFRAPNATTTKPVSIVPHTSHDPEYLKNLLKNEIDQLNFSTGRLISLCTDNAASLVAANRSLAMEKKYIAIKCFVHSFNLEMKPSRSALSEV